MLAAHPAVFTPGFEPLDMPGLTPAHKMRFLEATFEWPRASDGPAAWRAWRAALTPPVSGLRVDRKELGAKMVAGKSVAGFKLRPYVLAPGSDGGGGGGGASKGAPLGGGGGNHTAMVGLDPAAVRDVLQRFNVSVLLTLRRNTLKEALSWYKARELNISQFNALRAARAAGAGGSVGSGSGSSDAQRAVSALASSHDKVTIDIPRLRGWLSYTARVNSQLRQAVGYFNRPTLTVWYGAAARPAQQAGRGGKGGQRRGRRPAAGELVAGACIAEQAQHCKLTQPTQSECPSAAGTKTLNVTLCGKRRTPQSLLACHLLPAAVAAAAPAAAWSSRRNSKRRGPTPFRIGWTTTR